MAVVCTVVPDTVSKASTDSDQIKLTCIYVHNVVSFKYTQCDEDIGGGACLVFLKAIKIKRF